MLTPSLICLLLAAAPLQDPPPEAGAEQEPVEVEPAPHYLLIGATVHCMTAENAEPAVMSVEIKDGVITRVGKIAEAEGAEVIDLSGLHLVPGLIDSHVNFDLEHDSLYIANGVTTVRDVGNDVQEILQMRFAPIRDLAPGPNLMICGPTLSGAYETTNASWSVPRPEAVKSLVEQLDNYERLGYEAGDHRLYAFDYLSFRPDLTQETANAVCAMAKGRGLQVWGPIPEGGSLTDVIASGQRGLFTLEGLLPPGKSWSEVTLKDLEPAINALAASNVCVTPMLATTARQAETNVRIDHHLARLSPLYTSMWSRFHEMVGGASTETRTSVMAVLSLQRQAVKALHDKGVALVPGSGAPHEMLFPGEAFLDELDQWVEAGIPSGDVMELASALSADHLGIPETHGRIFSGASADLVVLGTDPRSGTLASFRDPEQVYVRGQLLERWDLEDRDASLVAHQEEVRAKLAAPIQLEPPVMPEGQVLLAGITQTQPQSSGVRVSAEHFQVVDLLDGRIAYGSRILLPGGGPRPDHEVHLVQTFKGDRLQSFELESHPLVPEEEKGAHVSWKVSGSLTGQGSRMSLRRVHTGGVHATTSSDQPVALVDFSDTLTALILGRHSVVGSTDAAGEIYPVRFVGDAWEPVQDQWFTYLLAESKAIAGQSPHSGLVVISGLDEKGVPIVFQRQSPSGVHELIIESVEGPGAPPKSGRVFDPESAR